MASSSASVKPKKIILGPDGLGKLKLGMTLKEARATGELVGGTSQIVNCDGGHRLKAAGEDYAPVFFSRRYGLGAFTAWEGVTTPEGIGLGSTFAQVRKAFPDWVSRDIGNKDFAYAWAKIPGRGDAVYNIKVENNAVVRLNLQLVGACY